MGINSINYLSYLTCYGGHILDVKAAQHYNCFASLSGKNPQKIPKMQKILFASKMN